MSVPAACMRGPSCRVVSTLQCVPQVAVFAPGVYEVTDYLIRWAYAADNVQSSQPGPPILLTVEDAS
jgi:hypothetical protein